MRGQASGGQVRGDRVDVGRAGRGRGAGDLDSVGKLADLVGCVGALPGSSLALCRRPGAPSAAKRTYLRAQFYRINSRRGPRKAIAAVAASILTAVYYILRDGVPYRDLGTRLLRSPRQEQAVEATHPPDRGPRISSPTASGCIVPTRPRPGWGELSFWVVEFLGSCGPPHKPAPHGDPLENFRG